MASVTTPKISSAPCCVATHRRGSARQRLWSTLGSGDPIKIIQLKDDSLEARQVVADLMQHQLRYSQNYNQYANFEQLESIYTAK